MLRMLLSLMTGKPHEPRDPRWEKAEKDHLLKEPTCLSCGGRKNLTVHHELPVSWPGGKARELDPENMMTLCEKPSMNCHLWVGHLGDYKSRNPNARADAESMLAKIQTRPYPER